MLTEVGETSVIIGDSSSQGFMIIHHEDQIPLDSTSGKPRSHDLSLGVWAWVMY